jgi:hypothetical protein
MPLLQFSSKPGAWLDGSDPHAGLKQRTRCLACAGSEVDRSAASAQESADIAPQR